MKLRHDGCLPSEDLAENPVWSVLDALSIEGRFAKLECPACRDGLDESSMPIKPYRSSDESLAVIVRARVELASAELLPGALMTSEEPSDAAPPDELPDLPHLDHFREQMKALARRPRAGPEATLIIFAPHYAQLGPTSSGVLDASTRAWLERASEPLARILRGFPLKFAADAKALRGRFRELEGTLALEPPG